MRTIASAEQRSRNKTKQKSMLLQMITSKMTCGFKHRYFSPPLMMPPLAEWKQILFSVRTWFMRRARGCGEAQRQAGDLCKCCSGWRPLPPTSPHNYHQSGAVAAGGYLWHPCGSEERPLQTNDHVLDTKPKLFQPLLTKKKKTPKEVRVVSDRGWP